MLIPTNHNLDDITYNQWDSKLSFNFVDNFLKEQLPWERGGRWRTKHSIYFSIWFSLKIIFPFLLLLFFHFNRFIISKSTKYLFFTLKVKKSRTFFFFFFWNVIWMYWGPMRLQSENTDCKLGKIIKFQREFKRGTFPTINLCLCDRHLWCIDVNYRTTSKGCSHIYIWKQSNKKGIPTRKTRNSQNKAMT